MTVFLSFFYAISTKQIDTNRTFSFYAFERLINIYLISFSFSNLNTERNVLTIFFSFDNFSDYIVFHLVFFYPFFYFSAMRETNKLSTLIFDVSTTMIITNEEDVGARRKWRRERKKEKTLNLKHSNQIVFAISFGFYHLVCVGIVSIMTAEGENSDDSRQFKALNIEHMQWLQVECLGLIFTSLFFRDISFSFPIFDSFVWFLYFDVWFLNIHI